MYKGSVGLFFCGWIALCEIYAHATSIEILTPCEGETKAVSKYSDATGKSVGELTEQFLKQNQIPYEGTASGLNSAMGTPVGDEALEIISDREMRAYGWCYLVDGVLPELLPHQYIIRSNTQTVRWFFASSHYLDGAWIGFCEPVYQQKPAFICRQ